MHTFLFLAVLYSHKYLLRHYNNRRLTKKSETQIVQSFLFYAYLHYFKTVNARMNKVVTINVLVC